MTRAALQNTDPSTPIISVHKSRWLPCHGCCWARCCSSPPSSAASKPATSDCGTRHPLQDHAAEFCAGPSPVVLGARSDGQYLNAILDEVLFFGSALGTHEVEALAKAPYASIQSCEP